MQKLPQKLLPMHLTTQQRSLPLMTRFQNLRIHLLQQSSQPTLLRMQSLTYRTQLQMNLRKLVTRNLKHYHRHLHHHHHHLHPKLPLNLRMHLCRLSIVLLKYLPSQPRPRPRKSTRK
jgi:hypothetical protein